MRKVLQENFWYAYVHSHCIYTQKSCEKFLEDRERKKTINIIEKSNIIVENTENKLGKKLCFPYIVEKILNYYNRL